MKNWILTLSLVAVNFLIYGQNTSLHFDGTDDVVTLGDINELDGVSAFTIETWAKFNSSSSSGDQLFSKFLDGNNNIQLLPRTSDILISIENGSSNFATVSHANNGIWQHYALVFDGTQTGNANRLKLYINGTEQTLSFTGTVPTTTDDNSVSASMGAGASALNQFAGNLDEYRIWSVARSATEIANNRFSTLTASSETNLISYYQFEHTDGTTTITDEKANYNGTWSGSSGSNTTSNFETGQDPLAPESNLFWAELGLSKIQRSDLNGTNVTDILTSTAGLSEPYDVLIDVANNKIYWSDNATDKILRSDIDGSNVETLFDSGDGLVNPAGLALDLVNNKIYWTDPGVPNIKRGNLDGTGVEELFNTTDGLSEPVGLAIDILNDKLYWTDRTAPRIASGDTDGLTAPIIISSSNMTFPMGIELDLTNGHIYFSDISDDDIERMDLDGSNRTTIVNSGLNFVNNLILDISNNYIYWTDRGDDVIQRADLDGSNITDIVTSGLNDPRGIAIVGCDIIPVFTADTVTIGATTTFTDASLNVSSTATYEWDFENDGIVDHLAIGNVSHTYSTIGGHTAKLTITDNGCVQSRTIPVVVNSVNYSLHFDGTDDYVQMSSNLSAIGNSSHTIEMWVKVPSLNTGGLLSGERVGAMIGNYDASKNFNYEINENGNIRIFWNNAQVDVTASTTDLRDDTWHHIAIVRDESQNKFFVYIDGALELTANSAGSDITLSTAHRIGGDVRNATGGHSFHGYMDDIRIWSTARSQTDIQNNRNTELSGTETNLEHYYKLDDINSSCDINDCHTNQNSGTRTGTSGTNNLPQFSTDAPILVDAACEVCAGCNFTVDFSATSETIGTATTFTDASTGISFGATYAWDFDNDGSTDATTVGGATYLYPSAGTFTAKLTITDGGCSFSKTVSVTVSCGVSAAFTTDVVQQGAPTTFTDLSTNVTGTATYAWDFDNDGSTDATTVGNATYTYPSVGVFTAKLTITDGACSSVATETVNICNITAAFTAATVTAGVPTSFVDASTNITGTATYAWDFDNDGAVDDFTVGNTIYTYSSVGTHTAKLTITDNLGCTDDVTNTVTIDPPIIEYDIYWTDEALNRVQRVDSAGFSKELLHFDMNSPSGVAIDETNGKIYWTDTNADKIFRANLGGSVIEDIVATTDKPLGIALDVTNDKMYWTDSDNGNIYSAALDGTNIQTIITGLSSPQGIDVDGTNSKIYFCEAGAALIKNADLDGSNVQSIITSGLTTPSGIEIDETNGKIYWTDIGANNIKRANVNGTSVQTLLSSINTPHRIVLDVVNNKMYWTEDGTDKIRSAALDGTSPTDFVTSELTQPYGLAFNNTQSQLYWTDRSEGKLERIEVDGSERVIIKSKGATNPLGMAIDFVNDKIYWVDRSNAKILRSELDGNEQEEIIATGLTEPIDIVLDASNNLMYWTDRGSNKIQKADLYGGSVTDIVTGLSDPMGIALDPLNNKIYWTDQTTNKIQRANLNGSSVEDVVVTGLNNPFDIAIDLINNHIYWTNSNDNKIQRADLDGSNATDIISSGLSNPLAIALDLPHHRLYWTEDGSNKIRKAFLDGTDITDVYTTNITTPGGLALEFGCDEIVAAFTVDEVNEGEATNFTDLSNTVGSPTYAWDFDNNGSTESTTVGDVTHTYSTAGNYTALLTVTDGTCISKVTVSVTVKSTGSLDTEGIYWTEYGERTLSKSDKDGNNQEVLIAGNTYVPTVAVDETNGKIYWIDVSTKKILRSNLDGTSIEDVISSGLISPLGLVLDMTNNKVYWTDAGSDKIQRANLDGTSVEDVITSGLSHPNSIAIDATNSKMYWTDSGLDRVKRANLDGTSIEDLGYYDRLYNIQLDVPNNKMYFSHYYYTVSTYTHGGGWWSSSHTHTRYTYHYKILSANLDGTNVSTIVSSGRPGYIQLDLTNNKLYWIDRGYKIYRSNLNGTSIEYLITSGLSSLSNVAFDLTNNKMYWSDKGTDKIQQANLDGTNIQDIHAYTGLTNSPYGVDIDVTNAKLYWAAQNQINRANIDGTNIENLVTTGITCARGMALDLTNNKMYWTDECTDKIQRANLDGSSVEDLVSTGLSAPHHIALDVANGKMYWTDYSTQKVQRANLDGSSVEDLVTNVDYVSGIDLDLTNNKIYWTSQYGRKIQRSNLDGTNVEDLITVGLSRPSGIDLDVANGKMYWVDGSSRRIHRANLDGSVIENVITTGISYYTYDLAVELPKIAPLPVDLMYFEVAIHEENKALLEWQTASEENNKGFYIQHSIDGKDWTTIDFVEGQGTTTEITDYTYIDEAPQSGINYYRLEQVDFDGTSEYSYIRSIYFGDTDWKEVLIYPNPFRDQITIENGEGTLLLFNALGQEVRQAQITATNHQMNLSDLAQGTYILVIQRPDNTVVTKQIVK